VNWDQLVHDGKVLNFPMLNPTCGMTFAPFNKAPFIPFYCLDAWHVAIINLKVEIKSLKLSFCFRKYRSVSLSSHSSSEAIQTQSSVYGPPPPPPPPPLCSGDIFSLFCLLPPFHCLTLMKEPIVPPRNNSAPSVLSGSRKYHSCFAFQ
jgi:hypothetical protein